MKGHATRKRPIQIYLYLILMSAPSLGDAQESKFKGFSSKCVSENAEGPETSPQSPPLTTDDPGTAGCNRLEINLTFDGDFSKGESTREVPLIDINYGIGDNLQLKYEIPQVRDTAGDESTSGWGDPKVGIKYHFYEDVQQELKISVYPQVEQVNSKTEHGRILSLPVLLSKKIGQTSKGDVLFAANLGYRIAREIAVKDVVLFTAGIGSALTQDIGIMGEISTEQAVGSQAEEKREQVVAVNLGLIGTINSSFKLYTALGSSVISSDDKQHLYVLAGARWSSAGTSF